MGSLWLPGSSQSTSCLSPSPQKTVFPIYFSNFFTLSHANKIIFEYKREMWGHSKMPFSVSGKCASLCWLTYHKWQMIFSHPPSVEPVINSHFNSGPFDFLAPQNALQFSLLGFFFLSTHLSSFMVTRAVKPQKVFSWLTVSAFHHLINHFLIKIILQYLSTSESTRKCLMKSIATLD